MVAQVEHSEYGKINVLGFPIKFSETPGRIATAPPTLGEHTDEVLKTLGLTDAELAKLWADRAIN